MVFECISDNLPPQKENFENGYPHSNVLLQSRLKLERYKPHKAAYNQTKSD